MIDLFYSGPLNIGNPDLKPEESISIEGGMKFQKSFMRAHILVFNRYGKNIIDWVKESEEDVWQSNNLTSLNASGFELNAVFYPSELIQRTFPLNYFSISYSFTNITKSSQLMISKYVLDFMKNKFTITTNLSIFKNTGINWRISYQNRAGGYINFDNGIFGKEVPYKPFWISDIKLFQNYKKHKIYLEISNLFNVDYQDFGNLPQAGRWIRLGINLGI